MGRKRRTRVSESEEKSDEEESTSGGGKAAVSTLDSRSKRRGKKSKHDQATDAGAFFWDVVQSVQNEAGVTQSTMMGFPCLRMKGAYFASHDHRTGDLIVKLPASRVAELVKEGKGESFSPAGRVFKEWLKVVNRDKQMWELLVSEAKGFVSKS